MSYECVWMEELDVHPRIINSLRKAKLKTYDHILSLSVPDLERLTNLSTNDVHSLQGAVAKAVPKLTHVTALDIANKTCPAKLQTTKFTTGCKILDAFLKGGVMNRGITEIAGESASGKTQLCMQLCITVQLPESMRGLDSGALYVCTEDVFPNKRLMQMVHIYTKRNSANPSIKRTSFSDGIFIEHASDLDDLQFCITRKAPVLVAQGRIKLIIIDSIAALFRSEFGLKDMVKRAKQLSAFAGYLRKLADQHGVSVVCVNQVSDVVDGSSVQKVAPALGISWANQVTTRLILSRTHRTIPISNGNKSATGQVHQSPIRTMKVLFAPHLPNSLCNYYIDDDGVKGICDLDC